jgi:hypothetical protein
MTEKGIISSINDIKAVFAHGGDIRANGTEGISARVGAEGAGDFLFDLDHSDIAFGEVVIKRDGLFWNSGG